MAFKNYPMRPVGYPKSLTPKDAKGMTKTAQTNMSPKQTHKTTMGKNSSRAQFSNAIAGASKPMPQTKTAPGVASGMIGSKKFLAKGKFPPVKGNKY